MSANPKVSRFASIADEAAAKYHENPALLLADIEEESGGNPVDPSSAGAEGLTQFIPGTAAEYGVKYGSSLEDERSQIFGQAAYLSSLGVNSNPTAALEAYSGNTPGYASAVLAKVAEYAGATGSTSGSPSTSGQTGATNSSTSGGAPSFSNAPEGLEGLAKKGLLYAAILGGGAAMLWLGTKTTLQPVKP